MRVVGLVFVLVMFLGVVMQILGIVVLVWLRLMDKDLDVLKSENSKVRLVKRSFRKVSTASLRSEFSLTHYLLR